MGVYKGIGRNRDNVEAQWQKKGLKFYQKKKILVLEISNERRAEKVSREQKTKKGVDICLRK